MPTLDINSNKKEVELFLKANKTGIKLTADRKRKSLKVLRDELEAGGYFIGVKGVSKREVKKGQKISEKTKASDKVKSDKYDAVIAVNPQGFNVSNTKPAQVKQNKTITLAGFETYQEPPPPPPTPLEIHMSGFKGIPILKKQVNYTVKEMMIWLNENRDGEKYNLDDAPPQKDHIRHYFDEERAKYGQGLNELPYYSDGSTGKTVSEMVEDNWVSGHHGEYRSPNDVQTFPESVRKTWREYNLGKEYPDEEPTPSENHPLLWMKANTKEMRDYLRSRVPKEEWTKKLPEIRDVYLKEKYKEKHASEFVDTFMTNIITPPQELTASELEDKEEEELREREEEEDREIDRQRIRDGKKPFSEMTRKERIKAWFSEDAEDAEDVEDIEEEDDKPVGNEMLIEGDIYIPTHYEGETYYQLKGDEDSPHVYSIDLDELTADWVGDWSEDLDHINWRHGWAQRAHQIARGEEEYEDTDVLTIDGKQYTRIIFEGVEYYLGEHEGPWGDMSENSIFRIDPIKLKLRHLGKWEKDSSTVIFKGSVGRVQHRQMRNR